MPKYFVWVRGLRGTEVQIWVDDKFIGDKPMPFIFKHKLEPHEENLDLVTLKKFYPYEAKP